MNFADRIHALRQIYAISLLIDAGRENEIAKAFSENGSVDFESLIDDEDKLFINAASTGSFWLTVTTKSTAAFKSLTNIFPLFYDEGRQAVLERVRANTELVKLDVDKKHLDIQMQKANGLIDLYNKIEKIKDPAVKDLMKAELTKSIAESGHTSLALSHHKSSLDG